MITLHARNVNQALLPALRTLQRVGIREDSRNGPVIRAPCPVTTVYSAPCERVMLLPERDANPFFHLVEAVWMLAGRDDLAPLVRYVPRMAEFSDDGGVTQPGAYGKRWRDYCTIDQLNWVVNRLRANPSDRRTVIQMWDPEIDIDAANNGGRDVPCNLTALPWVSEGRLHLTVFCRSNDAILGAYGANAVHFSVLLEYLAGRIGLPVGTYTQISNNFHAYLNGDLEKLQPLLLDSGWMADGKTLNVNYSSLDPYQKDDLQTLDMFAGYVPYEVGAMQEREIQEDLTVLFTEDPFACAHMARWPWLRRVVIPMMLAHEHWRSTHKGEDRFTGALEILQQVEAPDWRLAGEQWVGRRHAKWKKAADDGPTT